MSIHVFLSTADLIVVSGIIFLASPTLLPAEALDMKNLRALAPALKDFTAQ